MIPVNIRPSRIIAIFNVLAISLVVCLHLPSLPHCWVLDFGVPWFFFASGFWYGCRPRRWSEEVRKRVRSLLVPFFLWNLIWFPILFTMNTIGWKYFGAERVVDGSVDSIVRCLGLSAWRWPALVPTWFLRALFVAAALVGGLWALCAWGRRWGKYGEIVCRVVVACVLSMMAFTFRLWRPDGSMWGGVFTVGVPVCGMACFAVGGVVALMVGDQGDEECGGAWIFLRRQMMPIYLLHAIVIMMCGWCAKGLGCFKYLVTSWGDVIMWFVAVLGAILLGWMMRRFFPCAAQILFGGR